LPDVGLEGVDAGMDSSADEFVGDQAEEAFDLG
jgi:hypothetical protein